jgi:hypothetical protein
VLDDADSIVMMLSLAKGSEESQQGEGGDSQEPTLQVRQARLLYA